MTKIMAVNAGSSSLKFQLFSMPEEVVITSGIVERIGQQKGIFTIKVGDEKIIVEQPIADHQVAVDLLLNALVKHNVVSDLNEIHSVGHRVVHGGEFFKESAIVDEDVVKKVTDLCALAPLHNPAHLTGYYAFKKALKDAGHVMVFDTAFHQTLTPENFLYPIPYEYYTEYGVRKYGAHGTSHQFVAQEAAKMINMPDNARVIVCHLGNGASLTAVKDGISIATSMGFTPLAGVMMGTRSGDIDPSILPFIMEKTGMGINDALEMLNKKSGMLGISGISSDSRDIETAYFNGNERAILTSELYARKIADYIGRFVMNLGGVDAIAFTAGLGENAAYIRKLVIDKVSEALEISFNDEENNTRKGTARELSNPDSKVKVLVIPTNEELVIARDTYRLLN